jgi:hypothetical protein
MKDRINEIVEIARRNGGVLIQVSEDYRTIFMYGLIATVSQTMMNIVNLPLSFQVSKLETSVINDNTTKMTVLLENK